VPSNPEPRVPTGAIVLRAIVYALAIVALVLYAPGVDHRFIYQGF
jgi:hypothetical protein